MAYYVLKTSHFRNILYYLREKKNVQLERVCQSRGGNPSSGWTYGVRTRLVRENGEQTPVAGVEIQMIFVWLAEVGLFEKVRHAEHAFPEIDRALLGGANQCDVVNSLNLRLLHCRVLV